MTSPNPSTPPHPTPASTERPPQGARWKGSRRVIWGWVLVITGAIAAIAGLFGSYNKADGNPLPGGLLFIAVGAWLIHSGRRLKEQRIPVWPKSKTPTTPTATQSAMGPMLAPARTPSAPLAAAPQTLPPRSPQNPTPQGPAATGRMRGGDWIPPHPRGTEIDPWGPEQESVNLAGLDYRPEALKLAARHAGHRKGAAPVSLDLAITLVPDTHNPHGHGRAVAAYLDGEHTGYLPQEDADRFHHHLVELADAGLLLRVQGRGWVGDWAQYLSVRLPDPYAIRPSNGIPDEPHVVIPRGRSVQVAEEEQHMDILADYAPRGAREENHVAVTLKSINRIMPRSAYPAVSVLLNGQDVGVLSKGQSAKLLPLVKHIEERGLLPVAHAAVKGTRLAAEVTLSTIMAADADDDWLDAMGPAIRAANIDQTPSRPDRPPFDWDDDN